MSLAPGWADELGQALAGDGDGWHVCRVQGWRPFRICQDNKIEKAKRGAARGGGARKHTDARLARALGPVEDDQ